MLGVQAAIDPPHPRAPSTIAALVSIVLAVAAHRRAGREATAIALLAALVSVAMCVLPIWQLSMLAALVGLGLVERRRDGTMLRETWAHGAVPAAWTICVGGVTPFALTAWLALAKPDISNILGSELLQVPLFALVVGGVVFALLNAALEELIWRGVFQTALTPLFGARVAVVLQAISFGAQHAHGFPSGLLGVALACSWGVMLGALRMRSGGMLAPMLAHVVADATIAVLVIARLD